MAFIFKAIVNVIKTIFTGPDEPDVVPAPEIPDPVTIPDADRLEAVVGMLLASIVIVLAVAVSSIPEPPTIFLNPSSTPDLDANIPSPVEPMLDPVAGIPLAVNVKVEAVSARSIPEPAKNVLNPS